MKLALSCVVAAVKELSQSQTDIKGQWVSCLCEFYAAEV